MVGGHATWREEATAHLTPGRLVTGVPAAHLGALGEGQPVLSSLSAFCVVLWRALKDRYIKGVI